MRTFARDRGIWEDEEDDRLDEAVPLTAVPTELIEEAQRESLNASSLGLRKAVHAIFAWISDHEDGAR
jgi:hypothetical protein